MSKKVTLTLRYTIGEYEDDENLPENIEDWEDSFYQSDVDISNMKVIGISVDDMSMGQDYYFCLVPEGHYEDFENKFYIATKEHWKKEKCLEDSLHPEMPKGFHESCESIWEYYEGTPQQGRKKLIEYGFEELPDMWCSIGM